MGDGMLNGVDDIEGIFVGVEVGVNVESGMKKVAVAGTKGMSAGCSGNAALSELGTGNDPSGRKPERKIPVMAMAAIPMPMSKPVPRYLRSERMGGILAENRLIKTQAQKTAPEFIGSHSTLWRSNFI